jgi:hypothetical protein
MSDVLWKLGFFVALSVLAYFGVSNAQVNGQTQGRMAGWYVLALIGWLGLAVLSFLSPSDFYFKDIEAFSNRTPVIGSREIVRATSRGWKGGYDTVINAEELQNVVDDMYQMRADLAKLPTADQMSTAVADALRKELPALIARQSNGSAANSTVGQGGGTTP